MTHAHRFRNDLCRATYAKKAEVLRSKAHRLLKVEGGCAPSESKFPIATNTVPYRATPAALHGARCTYTKEKLSRISRKATAITCVLRSTRLDACTADDAASILGGQGRRAAGAGGRRAAAGGGEPGRRRAPLAPTGRHRDRSTGCLAYFCAPSPVECFYTGYG
ncbi:hypothetical protein EVAR_21135_1 [Eumeta japonica]|uniref:Uncharacterized protein n=1 Tax=Eumeta variegata TaxID=151549 RepID=A0A4C1VTT9_EUMVA|nr:hypothetical protein EVAR_21135_1 [Eumeta japonica]